MSRRTDSNRQSRGHQVYSLVRISYSARRLVTTVEPLGLEPRSSDFQSDALTISAKAPKTKIPDEVLFSIGDQCTIKKQQLYNIHLITRGERAIRPAKHCD